MFYSLTFYFSSPSGAPRGGDTFQFSQVVSEAETLPHADVCKASLAACTLEAATWR